MKILHSTVKNFEGDCSPTWLNNNQIDNRLDGGITGFFKRVKPGFLFKRKHGKEFHGIIRNGIVYSTEH